MPFAEGPRNCVGQSLAKMSLAATIATLLQTFSFRLADEARAEGRVQGFLLGHPAKLV